MYEQMKIRWLWLCMLRGVAILLCFATLSAIVQSAPALGAPPLTVPAKRGAAVVRMSWRAGFLPAMQAVGKAFPERKRG